jgi:hypothetical protein
MTPYEQGSLWIAAIQDGITFFALVAAVVGGFIGYRSIKAAQWSTLLTLEHEMVSRQNKYDELDRHMKSLSPNDPDLKLLPFQLAAAKESYFNALDRLASMVLNGQFSQEELKQDYRDVIKETIRKYSTDFGPGTPYRKVMKLYDKWEDGK